MHPRILLDKKDIELTLNRLLFELIENHGDFDDSIIIGLQPRGVFLARRLKSLLEKELRKEVTYGELDITFFRDDFRRTENTLVPNKTSIDFLIENKKVILIDDVLFTGRSIRSAMDAMLSFGRPSKVELLVLIDRKYSRHVPIEPNYVGKTVETIKEEKVKVEWASEQDEDRIVLLSK